MGTGESNSTTGSAQRVRVVDGAAPLDAVVADPGQCRGAALSRLLTDAAEASAPVRVVAEDVAAAVAVATMAADVGVRVLYTGYPDAVRHAVAMTHSIRGMRPPSRVVRGLA